MLPPAEAGQKPALNALPPDEARRALSGLMKQEERAAAERSPGRSAENPGKIHDRTKEDVQCPDR